MMRIFHNSQMSCKNCAYAVSFMERYKFEYKLVDISDVKNNDEYLKAENVLHELRYDIGILPFVMITDENGFTGFPSPETEYEILEYLEQLI